MWTPRIIRISRHNGEFIASSYIFQEDDFADPRLKLLRQREHLDEVVAPGKTQFEKIILLRHWAHTQWKSSDHFYYPPWDAVEILDLARRYNNRGFCAQYAVVFLQACQSLGIHARYVDLPGHFTVSVWSDDYNHWMIMDPTLDLYYEKEGDPLRMGQLCDAYWTKNVQGISKIGFDGQRTPLKVDDLSDYRMVSIVEKADQLSHPVVIELKGKLEPLRHQADYHQYPYVGRDDLGIGSVFLSWKNPHAKEFMEGRPKSDDPDDFRYHLNQTLIFRARRNPDKGNMKLVLLAEGSPTFDKYQIKINDADWQTIGTREVLWMLRPGMNTLSARIQTQFGWLGPVSSMTVFYKPAWWPLLSPRS